MVNLVFNQGKGKSTRIDLEDPDWFDLNPEHLSVFSVIEKLRPCPSYPDGLFPGATKLGDSQVSSIYSFLNYLEWSRVVEEDVVGLEKYITTRFFTLRAEGWASPEHIVKEGKTVGYCFNGVAYSIKDIKVVEEIVYNTIYRKLIQTKPVLNKLIVLSQSSDLDLWSIREEPLKVILEILQNANASSSSRTGEIVDPNTFAFEPISDTFGEITSPNCSSNDSSQESP